MEIAEQSSQYPLWNLMLFVGSAVEFDPRWIDAVSDLRDPPTLLATVICSGLLVIATFALTSAWLRQGNRRLAMRTILGALGVVTYWTAGILQFWLGEQLYRLYYRIDSSVNLGLWVPVVPVWICGVASALAVVIWHQLRVTRARSSPDRRQHREDSGRPGASR